MSPKTFEDWWTLRTQDGTEDKLLARDAWFGGAAAYNTPSAGPGDSQKAAPRGTPGVPDESESPAVAAAGPSDSELPGAIKLAVWFHDTYELLAPLYGYATRQETRVFNASSPNGKLMIAVCGHLRAKLMRSPATAKPISTEENP